MKLSLRVYHKQAKVCLRHGPLAPVFVIDIPDLICRYGTSKAPIYLWFTFTYLWFTFTLSITNLVDSTVKGLGITHMPLHGINNQDLFLINDTGTSFPTMHTIMES